MSRIELNDSAIDIMVKMSDGNPGAAMAISEIMRDGKDIDPDNIMGGLGTILAFDYLELYGTDIYVLYSGKCDKDVRKLLMLMRAYRLGFISQSKIVSMAKDQAYKINLSDEEFDKLDKMVCDRLPNFKKAS